MLTTFLKSKIHRASITGGHLDYEGSIGIDQNLLEASGIRPFEQVHVLNINNGGRFITYAIRAAAGSGTIVLNGAAARLGVPGDRVIILAYGILNERKARAWHPKVVHVDSKNRITKKTQEKSHAHV